MSANRSAFPSLSPATIVPRKIASLLLLRLIRIGELLREDSSRNGSGNFFVQKGLWCADADGEAMVKK